MNTFLSLHPTISHFFRGEKYLQDFFWRRWESLSPYPLTSGLRGRKGISEGAEILKIKSSPSSFGSKESQAFDPPPEEEEEEWRKVFFLHRFFSGRPCIFFVGLNPWASKKGTFWAKLLQSNGFSGQKVAFRKTTLFLKIFAFSNSTIVSKTGIFTLLSFLRHLNNHEARCNFLLSSSPLPPRTLIPSKPHPLSWTNHQPNPRCPYS